MKVAISRLVVLLCLFLLSPIASALDVDFSASIGPTREESDLRITFIAGAMIQAGPVRLELNPLDATYRDAPYDPGPHGYTIVPAGPGMNQCLNTSTQAPAGWWNCVGPEEQEWDYATSGSLTVQFSALSFDWALGGGRREGGRVETNYVVLSLVAAPEAEIVLRAAKDYGAIGIMYRFF